MFHGMFRRALVLRIRQQGRACKPAENAHLPSSFQACAPSVAEALQGMLLSCFHAFA
jgi:hypothetical protein